MKRLFITLPLFLLLTAGQSQNEFAPQPPTSFPQVYSKSLNKAKDVNQVFEITYPLASNYLKQWATQVDVTSVDIEIISSGVRAKATSRTPTFTEEQIQLIASADMGTQVNFNINYKNKNGEGIQSTISTNKYPVIVMPHKRARFTGPQYSIGKYFETALINRFGNGVLSADQITAKLRAAAITFVVDENGHIINPVIFRTSDDAMIDQTILELAKGMSNWLPAETASGEKVKQEVTMNIMWNGNGC